MNDVEKIASKYQYSKYMVARYLKLFGLEETYELLEANERKIKKSIRVNSFNIKPHKLIKRMEENGFEFSKIEWDKNGFYIDKEPYSIGATSEYLQGYYYIQKAASMIPVNILDISQNDIVLDMCAAPGGKLIQAADIMNNNGCIIGIEYDKDRIKSLRSNISRCGIKNAILFRMDAAKFPEFNYKVDKILLDAPCTGEGLIPFDKSRKKSRSFEDIITCSSIQIKLLNAAIESVKIGGIIVYSTCSIAPEENELVINNFLNKGKIEILDTGLKWGKSGIINVFGNAISEDLLKAKRFYPHKNGTQGFFVCKLKVVN
ncbi:MAG: NOL1/NOP2/sun family putative RNA methylase [Candidatus Helarchaeota archaeon]